MEGKMTDLDRIVKKGVKLAKYTTFGIGGEAEFFTAPTDSEDLRTVLSFAEEEGLFSFFLGGGSNVLLPDDPYEGMIVRPRGFRNVTFLGETVEAEACVALPRLLRLAADENLTGLENLSGIPGQIGGAVAKNAGAWGREIRDVLVSADVMTWEGIRIELSASELGLGYRRSKLGELGILLRATFRLKRGSKSDIERKMKEYIEAREKTQPRGKKTAGCIFKNPEGFKAGYLLDQSGMKEVSVGDARYSEVHANFIVNEGHATAKDVLTLIEMGKDRVRERFGMELEEEIEILRCR
jgi:UDP-N-acetylmuramate dehydrogenase